MSKPKDGGALTVWWFNADACKGDEMLEAGVMLKRFGDLARERVMANMSALTDPSQKQQKNGVAAHLGPAQWAVGARERCTGRRGQMNEGVVRRVAGALCLSLLQIESAGRRSPRRITPICAPTWTIPASSPTSPISCP